MKFNLRVLLHFSLLITIWISHYAFANIADSVLPTPMSTSTHAENPHSLRIGHGDWVGFTPFLIARENGYFNDAQIKVDLVKISSVQERFAALAAGNIDGIVTSLDTAVLYWKPDSPYKIVLALDESSGGDGIIAQSNVRSIANLTGKKIGVSVGSGSDYFLDYVLKQNHISQNDVTLVNVPQDRALQTLRAGVVDAAVTWDPYLADAIRQGTRVLITSKATPGLIVDVLVLRSDVLRKQPDVVNKLQEAWDNAINYLNTNPQQAFLIIQKNMSSSDKSIADIKANLRGILFYNSERNKQFLNCNTPGCAVYTISFAINFLNKISALKTQIKPDDLL